MIAVATQQGSLIKLLAPSAQGLGDETFGLHRLFGFISERSAEERRLNRKRHQMSLRHDEWLCRFNVKAEGAKWNVVPVENCSAKALDTHHWNLETPQGTYALTDTFTWNELRAPLHEHPKDRSWYAILGLLVLAVVVLISLPEGAPPPAKVAEILEPITVKVAPIPERQRAVSVPAHIAETLPKVAQELNKGGKGAAAQNLGFLGILGKKDLKGALGGLPSRLENVSPGAGPGGKGGSGGEMLVGLGQGVKRTTVGNTGVAGLGGLSTKEGGAGGGAGGYGNSMIASGTGAGVGYGNGKGALSALPLSQDIVLEGGLDRAVIQATIAKYLHEVRACYEQGLRSNPGLNGTISMAFEINGTGKLNYSKVAKSTLGNAEVEQCVAGRMMGWQFPKPVGGVNVKVTYPFLLRPVNS